MSGAPTPGPPAEGPVRIKLYGLLPVTRKGYLRLQVVSMILALALLAGAVWVRVSPPALAKWSAKPALQELASLVLPHLVWVMLGVIVLDVFEMVLTLRQFRRKEEERNAQASRGASP